MEQINKTIYTDNSRSHRNGLLPFVRFEGDGEIEDANPLYSNGNYGQYVCDFTIFSGETETRRLKYLDVIRDYNFVQEQLRNAIFVKKYTITQEDLLSLDCINSTKTEINKNEINIFRTDFDEFSIKSKYSYIPLDAKYAVENDNYYTYESSIDNNDGEFFVFLPNLEEVKNCNKRWNDWWGDIKEQVFNGYEEVPSGVCEEFQFCYDIDAYVLGRVEVLLGKKTEEITPNYVSYFDIYNLKETLDKNSEFYDFLSVITYAQKWQNSEIKELENGEVFKYSSPVVNLEVLINAEEENEGLYSPYEYSIENNELKGAVFEYSANTEGVGSALTPHFVELSGIKVESQLQTLMDPSAMQVSDGIFGCFETFGDDDLQGKLFECTYNGEKWVYSGCTEDMPCGDGEIIKSGDKKYRNVTILPCIDGIIKSPSSGDTYYFLSRFKNDENSPLRMPYTEGKPLNITTYDNGEVVFDIISDIERHDKYIEISYIKGATSGKTLSETGIHYKDRLTYYKKCEKVLIDGKYFADLYYESIGSINDKEIVYSEEYALKRRVLRSEITGMEVGTQWTASGAVSAILFAKESSDGLQEEPKYDINLLYNRGNAAAWESHFKLSECNTIEDLENYGNNYFNL